MTKEDYFEELKYWVIKSGRVPHDASDSAIYTALRDTLWESTYKTAIELEDYEGDDLRKSAHKGLSVCGESS